MPFQSEAQRRFMWAKHPEIAKKWAHGQHSTTGSDHKMPAKNGADVKKKDHKLAAARRLQFLAQQKGKK